MANVYSINNDKTLSQMLSEVVNSIRVSLNCVKIGEIVEFNKQNQTAKIRVLHIQDQKYDTRMEGELEYPILGDVPVVVLQGGGASITFPIKTGDQCLLLFCDYMIDNWWISGDKATSIVPRKHDLSDSIAIVGLQALPKAIQDYSDYLHLKYNENSDIVIGEQIDVNNETINLNGNTNISENLEVTKNANVTQTLTALELHATSAASGSFATADNKTVTVVDGIIVSIQ